MLRALKTAHRITQDRYPFSTLRSWRLGAAEVAHKPDHAESCQHHETHRDQRYEDQPDPAEWGGRVRVFPILHHAVGSHHAPAPGAPVTQQQTCTEQDQKDDEAHDSNEQPVSFMHFVIPFIARVDREGVVFRHTVWPTTADFDQTVVDQGRNALLSAHELDTRGSYTHLMTNSPRTHPASGEDLSQPLAGLDTRSQKLVLHRPPSAIYFPLHVCFSPIWKQALPMQVHCYGCVR